MNNGLCGHMGCFAHVTHPCENCGRIQGEEVMGFDKAEKRSACRKYIVTMIQVQNYEVEDEERIIAHDELLKVFGFEDRRGDLEPITSKLDIWIDYDIKTKNPSPALISKLSTKLFDVLESDIVKNGSWDSIFEHYKKLRTEWWDK